jgi:electron transfer flavoprotein beta subunit
MEPFMLKILVPLKRVIDYRVQIRVKPDRSGVVTDHVKMGINPFDAIALEQAIQLKEAGQADCVTLVSIGPKSCEEILRQGLAMGADEAILLECEQHLVPLQSAAIFADLVKKHQINLVLMGKQAIDDDNNQTGQVLAAKLDWPQGCFISKMEIVDQKVIVEREVDGGLETLEMSLPAVITADLRLNEPRLAKLPDIMKAKAKPLSILPLSDFTFETNPGYEILEINPPSKRKTGIKVGSVEELVDKLRHEAKVL